MKVVNRDTLRNASLLGRVRLPKSPANKPGEPSWEEQTVVLKILKTAIDGWVDQMGDVLPAVEKGTRAIQQGLKDVDKSIKGIEIPSPAPPITDLEVYNIERDMGGNMTGFQIKAIRGNDAG